MKCDAKKCLRHHPKKDFRMNENESNSVSENSIVVEGKVRNQKNLGRFERSLILQVYFARLDGRMPEEIPSGHEELYTTELPGIKSFLLGQLPQDTLLQKIFRIMT
jgi:hypothetical protein